ncbi:MAG: hypothetical protein H7240_08550 [Glaciimonas sp.]|nr:hypothetical protein [Glaciimonas sp.]
MCHENSLYKIISPGEEHYGSYVIEGGFSDPKYTVQYIAFPSVDWNNASAYYILEFDNTTSQFIQLAIVPIDGKIPKQNSDFSVDPNRVVNPIGINWENGKDLSTPPFPQK